MRYLVVVLTLLMVGCSSNVIKPELSDRYSKLETLDKLNAEPIPLPARPRVSIANVNGKDQAVIDMAGMNQLNAYRKAAEQNTEALEILTEAHNGLIDQRNLMLQNLRLEEARSNFFAEKYAESEALRREQYSDFQMELLIHKATLLLFGALLVF